MEEYNTSTKLIQYNQYCYIPNKVLTLLGPTPTNISSKLLPEQYKKVTPASPAIALARRVFPVPGAPDKRIPLGNFAPNWVNLLGFLRYSTTSTSSCFTWSLREEKIR